MMKNITNKILSAILALVMIIGVLPFSVFASDPFTISVSSVSAMAGETIDVTIDLKNNPGIASLGLNVTYGDILILQSIKFNTALGGQFMPPQSMTNPVALTWVNYYGNYSEDATFVTLNFTISEDAEDNAVAPITVTFDPDNIYNIDEINVDTVIEEGSVKVLPCTPGDINGDEKLNNKDVTRLGQYLAEWKVEVNSPTLDTNGDGNVNNKDLTRLLQFNAGWDVELWCKGVSYKKCLHTMTATEAKNPTCTEDGNIAYWYCSKCGGYFKDADGAAKTTLEETVIAKLGHTEVIIPAVDPTYDSWGSTQGVECSVCGAVLEAPEPVEPLEKDEYLIYYELNDGYIESVGVENSNLDRYTTQDGYTLLNIKTPGYNFLGWYDGAGDGKGNGANRITEFPVGTSGDQTVYAHWYKIVYTITYDSPDVDVPAGAKYEYTVDTGATLKNPSCYGYTFVGWSIDGQIVSSIKPGTTDHIILHANWTSNRNQAKSIGTLSDPEIIEDLEKGQYLFVYELGRIENVPINTVRSFAGNLDNLNVTDEFSITNKVGEGFENTMANTVSNATTKTSSWTLSEDWTSSTNAVNEHEEEKGKTKETTESDGTVTAGQWYVSNSTGGATSSSSSSSASGSTTSKVTTDYSTGISGKYQDSSENTSSVELETGASVKAGMKAGVYSAEAEVHASAKTTDTTVDKQSSEVSTYRDTYIGTYDENNSSYSWDTSNTSSSSWNSSSSYTSSSSQNHSTEVSDTISEAIYDRWQYSSTEERGSEKSETAATDETQQLSNEYISTVEYTVEEEVTKKVTETYTSEASGFYRIVTAGTIYVFGVVGYDIATNSYFTYTYNVLDKSRNLYLDYSKTTSCFDDCENGILPFEIPYYVNEFVSSVIARSNGLVIDPETGLVTSYNGDADYVIIPEYASFDNDGSVHTAVRVHGLKEGYYINETEYIPGPFEGNTNIKGVIFPKYVSAIPNNAFKGCTSLETVYGYSITAIGDYAFDGCTALKDFTVDKYITSLGTLAFNGVVNKVSICAADEKIADAALLGSYIEKDEEIEFVSVCGAKNISVDLSYVTKTYDGRKIVVDDSVETFELKSDGRAYNDLQIKSDAGETIINHFKFTGNTDTPLKIGSEKLVLNRVTIEEAPGFALIMDADNTDLQLYSTVRMSSLSENVVISKNTVVTPRNSSVTSALSLTGNYLVYGEVDHNNLVQFTDSTLYKIITLESETDYNNYLTTIDVNFDGNGGTPSADSIKVTYCQKYGTLPTAQKDNYDFAGWFTKAEGGEEITAESTVSALVNQTLYAHWTPKTFVITFEPNGGTVSNTTKTITFGESCGEMPVPVRDYYTFDGWYRFEADGGEKVTSETVFTSARDLTLMAHWVQNPVSEWVLESELPAGAEVIEDKWTYDLTTKTTSSSSTLSGYTLYDTTWVWGEYGSWSSWSKTAATASESRQVETKTVTDRAAYTNYKYYIYRTSDGWGYGTKNYNTSSHGSCTIYDEINLSYALPVYNSSLGTYGPYNSSMFSHSGDSYWFYSGSNYVSAVTHTEYRYRDRSKVYTYYFTKTESLESSTEVTASDTISNVKHYVKYRAK